MYQYTIFYTNMKTKFNRLQTLRVLFTSDPQPKYFISYSVYLLLYASFLRSVKKAAIIANTAAAPRKIIFAIVPVAEDIFAGVCTS